MFAHQVIEDLKSNQHLFELNTLREMFDAIRNSQHFHFGDAEYMGDKVGAKENKTNIFHESFGENINPPYQHCWFDYTCSAKSVRFSKLGFLLTTVDDEISILCFEFGKKYQVWGVWPVVWYVKLGHDIDSRLRAGNAGLYLEKEIPDSSINNMAQEGIHVIAYANFALLLLNCINIGARKNYPPEALNKKRLKHHKQPLFTYHTLVLKPTGKKQESIPRHLWENRIHLCRGHFKTYTEEKPLFGHITGRFWWQPSVRGRNREGVVMKDYLIANGAS